MKLKFKVCQKIKEAWPIYKENLSALLLMTIITLIVSMISSRDHFIVGLLSFVVGVLVFYVWIRLAFALLEKKKFNPFSKEALPTLKQYWNLLKTVLLYYVCVLGGLVLLVVPGLYFTGRLMFAPYLSVEKNQGARKSIKESWDATKGNGWIIFWKSLLIGLFMLVGFIAFFVGSLITYPIGIIVMVMLYREFFKTQPQASGNASDNTEAEKVEPKVEIVKDVPENVVKEEIKDVPENSTKEEPKEM